MDEPNDEKGLEMLEREEIALIPDPAPEVKRGEVKRGRKPKVASVPALVLGAEVGGGVIPYGVRKKLLVTLDHTPEEVVYYDAEGYDLFFDEEPQRFRKLPDSIWKDLRRDNQQRYLVSCALFVSAKKKEVTPEAFGTITVNDRSASATGRLKVRGKLKGLHYAWKRPDELRDASYQGYKVARHKGLETFRGKDQDLHKVGAMGSDELILMTKSQEDFDASQREIGEKSRRRSQAVDSNAIEDMRKGGGKPFVPGPQSEEKDWSPSK